MPPEPDAGPKPVSAPQPTPARPDGLGATVAELARRMLRLDPGALARLRRMNVDGPGEPEFWKLAVDCGLRGETRDMRLVRLMALLAPKGEVGRRKPFHRPGNTRALGTLLQKAGLSEARLARFVALPHGRRAEALERLLRFVVADGAAAGGIDCTDIARLIYFDDTRDLRKLSDSYYRRLDKAPTEDEETAR